MSRRTEFKIYKNAKYDTLSTFSAEELPVIPVTEFQTPISGGILYEPTTQRIYYATGTQWIPITPGGGGGGTSVSYSLIKLGEQIILPGVNTVVTGWTSVPNPPYHDNTSSWNLVTGVYTASIASSLSVDVDLSWKAGVSNIGDRILRVIYKPFAGVPMIVKEASTQADPNTNIETTQEVSIFIEMAVGDEVWVEVRHTSNINLIVTMGNSTSVSGTRIQT